MQPNQTLKPDQPESQLCWQFLQQNRFGQLVLGEGEQTLIVACHFVADAENNRIECHLSKNNPLISQLKINSEARLWLTVVEDYSFIPGYWNARQGKPGGWGAPTSYYAQVQVLTEVELVEEAMAMSAMINRQIEFMQPEGGTELTSIDHPQWGPMLNAICGLKLTPVLFKSRFKFGQNHPEEHREKIVARLRLRNQHRDEMTAKRTESFFEG